MHAYRFLMSLLIKTVFLSGRGYGAFQIEDLNQQPVKIEDNGASILCSEEIEERDTSIFLFSLRRRDTLLVSLEKETSMYSFLYPL